MCCFYSLVQYRRMQADHLLACMTPVNEIHYWKMDGCTLELNGEALWYLRVSLKASKSVIRLTGTVWEGMNKRSSDNTWSRLELCMHMTPSFCAIPELRHPRRTRLSSCVLKDGPLKQYLCYCIWNHTNVWGLATGYKLTKPMRALSRNNFSESLPTSAMNFISFVENWGRSRICIFPLGTYHKSGIWDGG